MNFKLKVDSDLCLIMPDIDLAQIIFTLIEKDREYLGKWLPWVDGTLSVKDTENNILERIDKFNKKEAAAFYVIYKNEIIASVGFVSLDNLKQEGEIGYWLLSKFQGQGLMTKCVKACINYGFEELRLNKIIIKCASKNRRSSAIPVRLGFTHKKTILKDFDAYELLKQN